MRISTSQLNRMGVNAMLEQQAQASRTQLQLSTGKRILSPSDDPAGAARILELKQAISAQGQYQDNATTLEARLNREEGALIGVGNLLQRVRELAIQGNNDTQNDTTRTAIATEVRQRLDELLALANTRDVNGEYLFAGFQRRTQPFATTTAGFSYAGDQGQRFLQVGPERQVADGDSGAEVFMAVRNGNGTFAVAAAAGNSGSGVISPGTVVDPTAWVPDTYTLSFVTGSTYEVRDSGGGLVTSGGYTDGAAIAYNGIEIAVSGTPAAGDEFTVAASSNQDIFTTLQNLATALEGPSQGGAASAAFHNAVSGVLADLDGAEANINEIRTRIGARLNAIEAEIDNNEAVTLQLNTSLSELEDVDFAEAVSRLNLQLTALQAAQQTYIRVQGLSLFNFLT